MHFKVRVARLRVVVGALQPVFELLCDLLALFGSQDPVVEQLLSVETAYRRPFLDLLVQHRLCVLRLIGFIVTVAPVTDHVHENVRCKLLPIAKGKLGHESYGLGIFSVHMEDGGLHHLRNVGCVACRARFNRKRSEADLVVDDEVYGPAGAVPLQPR